MPVHIRIRPPRSLHRSQWNQFDGAPTTSVVAIDGALRNNSMGVGLLMLHDQIGLTTQTDVAVNFAYRMRLGAGRLALGLPRRLGQHPGGPFRCGT